MPLRSAGGVVVQGTGDAPRVALMRSRYDTWVFPKGTIEEGEVPLDAARREIAEEIGVHSLSQLCELGATEHQFEQDACVHHKTVHWFLFRASDPTELRCDPSQYSLEVGWFPPEEALRLLSHADQRTLLEKALRFLGS
ncbi:MAG: NUDIX hydrolase [Armatimonadetes bacterium]|nr:NUDIX hydrolase [Armatimonadota bacterium]